MRDPSKFADVTTGFISSRRLYWDVKIQKIHTRPDPAIYGVLCCISYANRSSNIKFLFFL